jgi:4-hydroxyphenylpyruvate dioxygenase
MVNWSIATVCLGGTLETKLAAVAKARFRAVELFENDLTFFSGKPRDVRRMAEDLGLEIVALQPMRDFEAMPEPARTRNFERAARKFALMEELGTRLLCLCSNISDQARPEPARAAADLAELADQAARHGFRIGYEALAWGRHVRDWTQAWDIVRQADRPNLGIVLDSFHACVRGNDIASMADLPGDRIALVQIADAPKLLMDPLALSRHHRCFPGQGDLPMAAYLEAVLASGYDGPLSLEIFNDQFRGASASQIALDGMRALCGLAESLTERKSNAAGPLRDILPPMPKAPAVERVEFVEFAGTDVDAGRLARMLEGLGFVRAGVHRSKDVLLYRQNDVNIVLNREHEGFAHAFCLMHGTSVCALGLKVAGADAALARAEALGAATHKGRLGPGEAIIPAVRGVEGSLLYFVEVQADGKTIWDQDFVMTPDLDARGPLRRIDHLSNTVRRPEFLSWITFYRTVLGFEDVPQVEVADPYGAFYSRCVRSPGGGVQIPVNVADGGATVISRFIEKAGGAGVQQIAFETDDLFGFVEQAAARGVPFLPIPENYYDDLAARFDLPAALIERMRGLNILYDRVGAGEFFHIYTEAFDERFFFEVLERRNYAHFGAANTPVRLAAQAARQDADARMRLEVP